MTKNMENVLLNDDSSCFPFLLSFLILSFSFIPTLLFALPLFIPHISPLFLALLASECALGISHYLIKYNNYLRVLSGHTRFAGIT